LPGKKSVSIDLNFRRYAEGDNATAQDAIYTTWLSETPTGLTIVAGGGLLTINGIFVVESIEESQELDDSVTVSVSLKNYGTVTKTASGTGTNP
jgi:predicted secreted protein